RARATRQTRTVLHQSRRRSTSKTWIAATTRNVNIAVSMPVVDQPDTSPEKPVTHARKAATTTCSVRAMQLWKTTATVPPTAARPITVDTTSRSEEHTSELQS